MKKLMTMIAAVATAFGLYAADPLPTDNSESFAEAEPGTTITTGTDSYWAGEGITAAEAVVEEQTGGNVLTLKTGTKTLSRKLEKDATAYAIVSNVYFDTEINLMGQALEDFPTIPEDAKIAIFALDNSEYADETTGKIGTQDPWTALYALASDGNGGKMLYQLNTGIDITEDASHRITVQAYQNILKDGANVGFKIFIDGGKVGDTKDPAFIEAAYAFDQDDKVVWQDTFDQDTYLKGLVIPQLNSVRRTLFVGLVPGIVGQALTAMDFTGNAKIANIEINESGFDFIAPDAQLMSLVLNDVTVEAEPAAALDADNNILDDCTLTITTTTDKTIIKYSYGDEEETLLTGNTLDVTMTPNTTLTITSYAEAATVVDAESGAPIEGSPFTSFAAALDAANGYGNACILALKGDVDADTEFTGYIEFSGEVVLDLAGKTITGSGNEDDSVFAVINNTSTLTITDTLGDGAIQPTDATTVAAVANTDGTLNIAKGIFDGDVVNGGDETGTISAIGGQFKQSDVMTKDAVAEFIEGQEDKYEVAGEEGDEYWTVQEIQGYTVTVADGIQNGKVEVDKPKAKAGETVTVTATADPDYKLDTITVKQADETPVEVDEDGTFEMPAANVTVSATFAKIEYVAEVNGEQYETFEAAVAALTADDQTITLLKNAKLAAKVAPAFSTTFDMGGFELDAKLEKAITCTADKTLNVTNGTIAISNKSNTIEVYGTLNVQDGARIVKDNDSGPVIDVYDTATVNVEDGAYLSNGGSGQTFRFKDEFDTSNCTYTVNVKGGTINGTSANLFDVYKPGATAAITISGGTINATTLLRVGADDNGKKDSATVTLTISGGTINATSKNFVICNESKLNLTLNGDCKAKFKVDQGLNDYCAEGFKAKLNGEWYEIVQIEYAKLTIAEVENLTISVTNAEGVAQSTGATFDKDLATELYVTRTPAANYELDGYAATETITMSADVTVTGAVKSAAQPVNPGEEKKYEKPEEAEAAAKNINDHKDTMIRVPDVVPTEGKAAYLERVAAKVKADGVTVVVDIAADKEATFEAELDAQMKVADVAAALTDATATTATITTKAGFYYWIEGGVEVGTITTNGKAEIGNGETKALTKPTLEAAATAGKAFYKLAVGVKDPAQ